MSNKSKGLREQIAAATTADEVRTLLSKGIEHYQYASFRTVRRWQVTADRRIKELEAAKPKPGTKAGTVVETVAALNAELRKPAYVSNGRAERRRLRRAGGA